MVRQFLKLEWKAFTRSSAFEMNLALKIIIGVGVFFYSLLILFLGVAAFYGLDESGLEPLSTVNSYLLYWWAIDLIVRYFMQKTPVMRVKPLLVSPLSKKKITHYLMGKSLFSFLNFYPLFFFLPFTITLLINEYSIAGIVTWHIGIMAITFINSFINLTINNKNKVFVIVASCLLVLGGLHYFGFINTSYYSLLIFQSLYDYFWPTLLLLGALVLLYAYNFSYFLQSLYVDDIVQKKVNKVKENEYGWLDKFGLMGVFLKNDLRLLLRNKRAKTTLWMSVLFLFYGLIFFTNDLYKESDFWLIFSGVFVTGGFLFSFGGLVPSWDSSYYPLMMSQNIKYREYLLSKWWMMVIVTFVCMLISSFYLVLGAKYYLAVLVGGIYNIGINSYITLLSGAYVKTPIDLESSKKPFGDSKSFNIKTLLLTIPKILLPIGIYYLFAISFGDNIGFLSVALIGVLGLLFRNSCFKAIERLYKKEKYDTLYAYKQKG